MDELQEQVEKLKAELSAKDESSEPPSMKALELENLKHLELIAELKLELEQVRLLPWVLDCTTANCETWSG